MKDIDQIYRKMKKELEEKPEKVERIKTNLNSFVQWINHTAKEKGIQTVEQIKQQVENSQTHQIEKYINTAYEISGTQVQQETCQYLNENPEEIEKRVAMVLETPYTKGQTPIYTSDLKKSINLLLMQAVDAMRIGKMQIHSHGIKEYMKSLEGYFDRVLRDKYTQQLLLVGHYLDSHQMLETYTNQQNDNLKRIFLEELGYQTEEVKKIFTPDYLASLETKELLFLNIFWQNRYAKEFEHFEQSANLVERLDWWEKLLKGQQISQVPDSDLKQAILQDNFMKSMSRNMVRTSDNRNGVVEIDRKHYKQIEETCRHIWGEENSHFQETLQDKLTSEIYIENIYRLKTNLIYHAVHCAMNDKQLRNWGYIPEREQKYRGENTQMLIGIDYPGHNLPLMVHVDKKAITTILDHMNQAHRIPIYEGSEDFEVMGKRISTNIYMPVSKEQKQRIKQKIKGLAINSPRKDFLEHVYFLAGGDFPLHLKEEIKEKNQVKKVRKRKYLDLETNRIGILDKQGNIVLPETEMEK